MPREHGNDGHRRFRGDSSTNFPITTLIWPLWSITLKFLANGLWRCGAMSAATMDQTDIRGLVAALDLSVVEAASL
jgi:hypothetical protein